MARTFTALSLKNAKQDSKTFMAWFILVLLVTKAELNEKIRLINKEKNYIFACICVHEII